MEIDAILWEWDGKKRKGFRGEAIKPRHPSWPGLPPSKQASLHFTRCCRYSNLSDIEDGEYFTVAHLISATAHQG